MICPECLRADHLHWPACPHHHPPVEPLVLRAHLRRLDMERTLHYHHNIAFMKATHARVVLEFPNDTVTLRLTNAQADRLIGACDGRVPMRLKVTLEPDEP